MSRRQYFNLGDAMYRYKCPYCGEDNYVNYYIIKAMLNKEDTANVSCYGCEEDVELVPLP